MTRWLAAVLLLAADGLFFSFAAQAYCSRPGRPFIVGGYGMSQYNMESTRDDVRRYVRGMREYVDCLDRERRDLDGRESRDAENEVSRVIDEWRSAVSSYDQWREREQREREQR